MVKFDIETKEKAENLGLEQLKLYEESSSTKSETAKSEEKVKRNKSKSGNCKITYV